MPIATFPGMAVMLGAVLHGPAFAQLKASPPESIEDHDEGI